MFLLLVPMAEAAAGWMWGKKGNFSKSCNFFAQQTLALTFSHHKNRTRQQDLNRNTDLHLASLFPFNKTPSTQRDGKIGGK